MLWICGNGETLRGCNMRHGEAYLTGEIINLRQRRKQRSREEKTQRAHENRAKHGRTRAERLRVEETERRRNALLDGVRREHQDEA